MTDKGEQRITRFHVSPHILLHTWDETWGLLQQVSGDGAKICYKNPVLLKVAFGHLFYLQKNNQRCPIQYRFACTHNFLEPLVPYNLGSISVGLHLLPGILFKTSIRTPLVEGPVSGITLIRVCDSLRFLSLSSLLFFPCQPGCKILRCVDHGQGRWGVTDVRFQPKECFW